MGLDILGLKRAIVLKCNSIKFLDFSRYFGYLPPGDNVIVQYTPENATDSTDGRSVHENWEIRRDKTHWALKGLCENVKLLVFVYYGNSFSAFLSQGL